MSFTSATVGGLMWIIPSTCSLLTSQSQWFAPLSMLKLSVLVFALLWLSYLSIQILRRGLSLLYFLSLCISLLALGISSYQVVHAQTVEPPTVTPTWENLFSTSTVAPTQNKVCPGYQPVGIGTVTPDPAWLLGCSVCVTPAVPTIDPTYSGMFGTPESGTPAPHPSPTGVLSCGPGQIGRWMAIGESWIWTCELPTPTPTLTPTSAPVLYKIPSSYTADPVKGTGVDQTTVAVARPANECRNSDPMVAILFRNWWTTSANNTYSFLKFGFNGSAYSLPGNFTGGSGSFNLYERNSEVNITLRNLVESSGLAAGYTKVTNDVPMYTGSAIAWMGAGTSNQTFGHVSEAFLLCYGVPLAPTATPTPTVTPGGTVTATPVGGICSVVQGPDPVDIPSLPSPIIGPMSCPVDISGFTVSLSWLAPIVQPLGWAVPSDISFPGIRVCFRPMKFGVLHVLGVNLDMDILAFIAAAVALLRLVTRS